VWVGTSDIPSLIHCSRYHVLSSDVYGHDFSSTNFWRFWGFSAVLALCRGMLDAPGLLDRRWIAIKPCWHFVLLLRHWQPAVRCLLAPNLP
jgi:hypothetical protein